MLKLRGCDTFQTRGGGHYRTVVCSSRVLRFSGSTTLCDGVEPISVGREASCLSAFPFQETLQAQLEETHEEDAAWRDINQLMLKKHEKKNIFLRPYNGQMFQLAIGNRNETTHDWRSFGSLIFAENTIVYKQY